jgi:hypothetical protein
MLFRYVATFAILALIPCGALAHTSGASYEQLVGEYQIDIGYDPPAPFGGDRLVFDFGTFSRNGEPADFDYVWVRIEDDVRTVLATGVVQAEFGPTSLLYSLPNDAEGEYRVHARYQKGNEVLAEVEFPIQILRSPEITRELRNRIILDGLVILLAISALLVAVRYKYART